MNLQGITIDKDDMTRLSCFGELVAAKQFGEVIGTTKLIEKVSHSSPPLIRLLAMQEDV